jgi:hypothetical protein
MSIEAKIVENSSVVINGTSYKVLGKAEYATQNDENSTYLKILLEDHFVLVLVPSEEIAYFGRNEGRLTEFDGQKDFVSFKNKKYKQVNHDYQVVINLAFGSPLTVEGEVEFWDYEVDNSIISVAVVSRTKERADVVAEYITYSDIDIR